MPKNLFVLTDGKSIYDTRSMSDPELEVAILSEPIGIGEHSCWWEAAEEFVRQNDKKVS